MSRDDIARGLRRRGAFGALVCALLVAIGALLMPAEATAQAPPSITWTGPGTAGPNAVALSPDGQIMATGAADETVKLWRVSDGSLIRTLTSHLGAVHSIVFSPNGQLLATGGELVYGAANRNVKLWRVSDGALIRELTAPMTSIAWSLAFSPDGALLAEGDGTSTIHIWRVSDGKLQRTLTGHAFQVLSVAFSPASSREQLLASGSGDNTVKIWRVSDGKLLHTLTGHAFFVTSVAFSPDGRLLASGSFDATVRLWRVPGLTLVHELSAPDAVETVAFSANGQTLASAGRDKAITLWRPATGARLRTLTEPTLDAVRSVVFSGGAVLASISADSHPRLWSASTGALQATFGQHVGSVRTAAFAPNEQLFASGGADSTATIRHVTSGAVTQTLAEHKDVINQVSFSSDSQLVATAAGAPPPDAREHTVKIWRVGKAASMRTLPGHDGGSTGAVFSRDGRLVITSGRDGALRFWRRSDGALIRVTTEGAPVGSLVLSPDGQSVAIPSESPQGVMLYRVSDGMPARTLTGNQDPITCVSFSSDGALLVGGAQGYGQNIHVWRLSDGSLIRTLPGDPNGFVQGVAFVPGTSMILSGSGYTHLIQVWDPASQSLLASYDRDTGWGPDPQLPIAASPSGLLFGFGRGDATVVLARTPFHTP
jgi:WD40 repeat protein